MVFGERVFGIGRMLASTPQEVREVVVARQPVDEPGADGRRLRRPRAGDAPVITGQTGVDPIFQDAADSTSS